MNTLELPSPAHLSPAARAAEITAVLATAIVRTLAAQPPERRDSALASCPTSAFMQPRIKTGG